MHDRRRRTWLLRLGVVALAGCLALATFGWHHDHGNDRGRLSGTPGRGLPGTTFKVASFNMLGAVHTDTGQRPGWASSYKRTAWAAQLMAENGLQVIGLQEFEAVQYDRFKQVTGSTYGPLPRRAARAPGHGAELHRLAPRHLEAGRGPHDPGALLQRHQAADALRAPAEPRHR